MKPASEKQLSAIERLARATRTKVDNVEGMSGLEASGVISALIEKMNRQKGSGGEIRKPGSSYSSDALAGLAVKILAQRHNVKSIISQRQQFKERVKELYEVFSEARQACLA